MAEQSEFEADRPHVTARKQALELIDRSLLLGPSQRQDAADLCRHALRIEPANALAHYVLGLLLASAGCRIEARQEWQSALDCPALDEEMAWARNRAQKMMDVCRQHDFVPTRAAERNASHADTFPV